MKLLRMISGIMLVLAAAALLFAQADTALQKAIRKETVEGDLKGAIEQYKKLARGSNRAIAAQALLRMGECYEKLGSNQAREQYELVISKFADQKDAVAMAQSHLSVVKTSGMVNHPVWEGSEWATSVSPDGRYIAFSDRSGGGLKVRDLVTGTDRLLVKASAGEIVDESAFSPDGKQIAYIWGKVGPGFDLRVLNLSAPNASPRVFKNANSNYDTVAWSPDGNYIAVFGGPSAPGQVGLVSVRDGSFRPLVSAAGVASNQFFFSPDGKFIAYDRSTNGRRSQKDIFIVAVDSGRETPVVVSPSDDSIMGWAKDGRLLFASDRGVSWGLWAQQIIDGKPQGQPVLIKTDIGNVNSLGMTSSGSLYYYVPNLGTRRYLEIAPFDFTTGRVSASSVAVGQVTQQDFASYEWSPDGKYLAYVTPGSNVGDNTAVAIRSMNDGQSRVLLPSGPPGSAQVGWAPDNRTLLVSGMPSPITGPSQIRFIDTQTGQVSTFSDSAGRGAVWDGGSSLDQKKIYFRRAQNGSAAFFESDPDFKNEREIIRRPNLGGLNLTPDRRTIVTKADPNGDLTIAIPVAGGETRELLRRPDSGNIFISPDGKYLALALSRSTAGGAAQLGITTDRNPPALLLPIDGGEPRELLSATPPQVVSMGMWAPDSKSIFLRKSLPDGQQAEIWRVPVDGGQAVKVDIGLNLDQITGPFGVSPKGDHIGFVQGTGTSSKSEIWALENFLPPLK